MIASPKRFIQLKQPLAITAIASALILSGCGHSQPAADNSKAVTEASLSLPDLSFRSDAQQSRDRYRNPKQTLEFFELKNHDSVVEIWPGGGWYTQILAPTLRDQGQLIAAHWPHDSQVGFFRRLRVSFEQTFLTNPQRYGEIKITELEPPKHLQLAQANSVDKVFTFRNVHNWMRNNQQQAVFNAAFSALKPGGIFGVVEHRAPDSFNYDKMVESGYVSEAYVKQLAEAAGFEFIAASEINANAKDNKDHPKGVWTLPPSLRLGDQDREKYLAIGESDRMTLKFRKPENK